MIKTIISFKFKCDEFASDLVVMFRNPYRKRKTDYIFSFLLPFSTFSKIVFQTIYIFSPDF